MSLYLFRDIANELDSMRPSRIMDQQFGLGLSHADLMSPLQLSQQSLRGHYVRPWRMDTKDMGSTLQMNKDKFQVNLDVQQFLPEEVKVKVMENSVVVEARHEEKPDEHGLIARQFQRKYMLPKGFEMKDVMSTLSLDGILTITALKSSALEAQERLIPIMQTGMHKGLMMEEKKEGNM